MDVVDALPSNRGVLREVWECASMRLTGWIDFDRYSGADVMLVQETGSPIATVR